MGRCNEGRQGRESVMVLPVAGEVVVKADRQGGAAEGVSARPRRCDGGRRR